jgi:hypothetical protein
MAQAARSARGPRGTLVEKVGTLVETFFAGQSFFAFSLGLLQTPLFNAVWEPPSTACLRMKWHGAA